MIIHEIQIVVRITCGVIGTEPAAVYAALHVPVPRAVVEAEAVGIVIADSKGSLLRFRAELKGIIVIVVYIELLAVAVAIGVDFICCSLDRLEKIRGSRIGRCGSRRLCLSDTGSFVITDLRILEEISAGLTDIKTIVAVRQQILNAVYKLPAARSSRAFLLHDLINAEAICIKADLALYGREIQDLLPCAVILNMPERDRDIRRDRGIHDLDQNGAFLRGLKRCLAAHDRDVIGSECLHVVDIP